MNTKIIHGLIVGIILITISIIDMIHVRRSKVFRSLKLDECAQLVFDTTSSIAGALIMFHTFFI